MEPVPSETVNEEEFKIPALPCGHKQRRTMEWLQMEVEDIHRFDPDALPLYGDRMRHISDASEGKSFLVSICLLLFT